MAVPLRLRHAFKTALAAVAAVSLAMAFRWDMPYWAGITVLVVMLPYVGASLKKSLHRLAGTWLGALAGVLMTVAFAQSPLFFTLALAVVIVVSVYLAGDSYGVIMGAGTMAIIVFSGLEDPYRVWHFASYRGAEIALGILVGLLANVSLWPRKAGDDVVELAQKILRDLEAYHAEVVGLFTACEAGEGDLDLRRTGLLGRFRKMEKLLGLAVLESYEIKQKQELYRSLIFELKELFISLSALRQSLEGETAAEYRVEFRKELEPFDRSVRIELENFIAALGGRRLEGTSEYRKRLRGLRDRLDGLRRRSVPRRYPEETSLRVLAFLGSLSDLKDSLASTRQAIERLRYAGPVPLRVGSPLTLRSLIPDSERLKYGVRIAAGILIAFYGWWMIRWPSGIQVIISFLVVTGQPHIAAVNVKSVSRLAGALIGCFFALLSCLFILPHLESYWGLGLLLFAFLFATSYVNAGPPRYAYTGFQAGLCFLLTVAQGFHKDVTFVPALDRAVGIILGALLGAVVVRFIFPPAPRRELCRDLERLFGLFRTSLERMEHHPVPPDIGRALSDRSPVLLNRGREWLDQMHFFRPEEGEKVSGLLPSLQLLSFRLMALCRARAALGARPLIGRLEPTLRNLHRGIEETLDRCREVFRAEELERPMPSLKEERAALSVELKRIRREGESVEVPTEEICRTGAAVIAYANLAATAESCGAAVSSLDLESWDSHIPI